MEYLDLQVNMDTVMVEDKDWNRNRNHSDLDIGEAHGCSMVKVIILVTDHGDNHYNKNEVITIVEGLFIVIAKIDSSMPKSQVV